MYEKTYNTRVLKQEKPQKIKKGFSWKKILIIFLILGFIWGVIYVIRHPRFQIVSVEVSGAKVLDVEDIISFTKEQLLGKSLWFLPKSSVFLIDENSLKEKIQKNFSRIESISISRKDFRSLNLEIKEFEALYLWCNYNSKEDCYFMDKQGFVYSRAPVFSGTAYPKIITNKEISELPFLAMEKNEVDRISILNERLLAIKIVPAIFSYVSEREINIEFLHNKTFANIKIDKSMPTETTLEYIFSAIRTEPFSSLFNNQEKKLLYIDVRFPSKIVYKFE